MASLLLRVPDAHEKEDQAIAFKPNYNHQRAERARAKEQKKQQKEQRRREKSANRKAEGDEPQSDDNLPESN